MKPIITTLIIVGGLWVSAAAAFVSYRIGKTKGYKDGFYAAMDKLRSKARTRRPPRRRAIKHVPLQPRRKR